MTFNLSAKLWEISMARRDFRIVHTVRERHLDGFLGRADSTKYCISIAHGYGPVSATQIYG